MEKSKCPKCEHEFFEVKQGIVLQHNIPDQKPETFDAIQCAKCGTIIHCFNLDISPDRKISR